MKIALAIISKGEGEDKILKRALESISPYVDKVFITFTGDKIEEAEKVAVSYDAQITKGKFFYEVKEDDIKWLREFFKFEPHCKVGDKLFMFDEARNFCYAQVPKEYEWIMWVDCDDVVKGGENIQEILAQAEKENIEAIYLKYLYQVELDEKGAIKNVIIEHLRERITRNNGKFKWIAPIHETLIEQVPTLKKDLDGVIVVHLVDQEKRLESLSRNFKNLELAILKSKGKDPRHIYYLAKAYYDLRTTEDDEKAITFIYEYLLGENKSGWIEERAQAWEYLCEIFRRRGDHDKSIECSLRALSEAPESPSIFINLATSYMMKGDWERSLFWIKQAHNTEIKKTTLVVSPKDMEARKLEVIYNACINLSRVDEAWAAAVKLVELFPDDPNLKNCLTFVEGIRTQRELTNSVLSLTSYLKKTGEWPKIKPLLASVPAVISNNPFIINLYNQNYPPKYWDKDEIALWCGPGFTNWSPKRLSEPQNHFIGGSEEAVILLAKHLAKQGWRITVYADPGEDEGEYDGVKYLPYYKLNRNDKLNILIVWRQIGFVDNNLDAKKIYVWNHDIQNPLDYNKERLDKVEKVFFLSNWHRENIPDIPDEKVFITSNGIEV